VCEVVAGWWGVPGVVGQGKGWSPSVSRAGALPAGRPPDCSQVWFAHNTCALPGYSISARG
jgi:hypothetical protein